jgi:hypothetical protein
LVALNSAVHGTDVSGTVNHCDHNLIGNADGSTGFSTANGDQFGTTANPLNPGLATALANNGGPTQTLLLQSGSPALAAGDPNVLAITGPNDQRGADFPRVSNGVIDIGALEITPSTSGTGSGGSSGGGGSGSSGGSSGGGTSPTQPAVILDATQLQYDGMVEGFYSPFASIPQVQTYLAYIDLKVLGNPYSQGYSSQQLLHGQGPANADSVFEQGYTFGLLQVQQALASQQGGGETGGSGAVSFAYPLLGENLLFYDAAEEGFYSPFASFPPVQTYLAYVDLQVMGNPLTQGYSSQQLLSGRGPANAVSVFQQGYQYGLIHVEQALTS